jgi:Ca2+-binding RTX toxin-like protein
MDNLAGGLTVNGEGGTDTLTINDGLAAKGRSYVINTDKVSQGAAAITLDSLEGLTINAANGAARVNTFDVQSTTALMPLTLNGGLGRETVTMSDEDLTGIQTYNFNAGSLERWTSVIVLALPTAYVNYSGVEKMIVNAGSSNDTFKMTETAQPDLTINAGAGIDTLDYSAFSNNVYVNLFTGTNAAKVASLSGVENVTGGMGNDVIVGDAHDNVLVGNDGNDVIIGGEGADHLSGGAGEDLMIAGYTDFDGSKSQLQTIRNTWADASKSEQDRVTALKVGIPGTSIQLNDFTVHDDLARDVLSKDDPSSPPTPDWFWGTPGNLATQDDLPSLSGEYFK